MKRFFLGLPGWLLILAMSCLRPAFAQNLLTNNAGFEANTAYYTPAWGYPQGSPDVLPGWLIMLDPAGDGFVGAATNQSPPGLEGTHYAYIYSGTGSAGLLTTAADSRAAVEPGAIYTLWFLARGDASWTQTLASVSLVWYHDNTSATEIDRTNLSLALPIRGSTNDPMQSFHLTSTAPPAALYAGVQVARPAYDYAPLMVDDFVIMLEPAQISLSIKQAGTNCELCWPRSLRFQLQENTNPSNAAEWHAVASPVRGIGATNYLDYPISEDATCFRLAAPAP